MYSVSKLNDHVSGYRRMRMSDLNNISFLVFEMGYRVAYFIESENEDEEDQTESHIIWKPALFIKEEKPNSLNRSKELRVQYPILKDKYSEIFWADDKELLKKLIDENGEVFRKRTVQPYTLDLIL
jgi:hypothetical protein